MAYREMRFSGAMRYALPWLYQDLDEIDKHQSRRGRTTVVFENEHVRIR